MRSLLAAAIFALSTGAQAGSLPEGPHLYVKGMSSVEVQPDAAIIRVAITEKHKSLPDAKANVDQIMAKAIQIARDFDIKTNDIHAEQLNVHRQTRYNRSNNEEEFDGFRVSRSLTVKLKDLAEYPNLLQAFVDSGINQFNNTEFVVEDKAEYMKKLKKSAIEEAKAAARELADDFDVELGRLYSVSFSPMNVPVQPYARGKMMAAESMDVSQAYNTGDTTLTAEVYAVYFIE
ncbi:SIMPL domain-containing protein [Pseudoalteromonas rubra]|uniref:SIMPL domain-containing protein n=1 Tax=Pseudoalteromonas rubra TaxID=43658 RepID=A0A5S3WSD2_9GAMM|nr:SIMPL domain-containing protein [Pseudoalteromonas rubra]TMP30176.1 SIMPL domain-containing protein [Pseudoalteromonas rubra]TMP31956.1 SIMPL domain-containing protein [Pseudoalteromonas rubra]